MHYITNADANKFQPANITFDLLPPLEKNIRDRQLRRRTQCELGLKELESWLAQVDPKFGIESVMNFAH